MSFHGKHQTGSGKMGKMARSALRPARNNNIRMEDRKPTMLLEAEESQNGHD